MRVIGICCMVIELFIIIGQYYNSIKIKKDREFQISKNHVLEDFIEVMTKWIALKQDGINLATYLEKQGNKKVAIYGFSNLGRCLLNELENSKIEVIYIIDKKGKNIFAECPVFTPNDELPNVDIVIITTADHFVDEIERIIDQRIGCECVTIKELIARA